MIYFDNAATSGKKPLLVIKSVEKGLLEYSANPGRSGHSASIKTSMAVFEARKNIADFFGCSQPEKVVFTLNCTHSINCVLKGVLRKGDHVIVSSFEHNAVMRPLKKMGNPFSIANVSLNDDLKTFSEFSRKIKPNTRLIICTAASNVFGKTLPIKEIGRMCRERGILFAVDAAQTAGVLPINMQEMCIDYLCVAAHKGLYAPMGVGILICEKNIQNTILEGGTGTNSAELFQPEDLPERLESGTVNVPGIMGVSAGVNFVKTKGLNKIYTHEMSLIQAIYRALKETDGIELYTPYPEINKYVPVLSFNFDGVPSEKVAERLSKSDVAVRGGLHCAPVAHNYMGTEKTGTVRVSVSAFNDMNEVNRFINVIKDKKFSEKLKKDID